MADQAAVFNLIHVVNNGILVIGDNTKVKNVFINPTTTSSHTSGLHGETVRERNTDSDEGGRPQHHPGGFEFSSEQYLLNEKSWEDGVQVSTDVRARQDFRRQKRKKESLVDHVSDSLRSKKIERKRSKRHKQNSRFSTTSSDEDTQTSMLNKLALTDENGLSLEQALTSFHLYSKRLHLLRDNGRWEDFASAIKDLLDQNVGNLPCQIMLRLEESVVLSYQNKLEESEKVMNEATRRFAQTSGPFRRFCEVLSNCYYAALYRRQKRLGKSKECLDAAKKLSAGFPSCLAIVNLHYEEGSYKRDFALTALRGSRRESTINEARELMQKCVDLCRCLDPEQVHVGKQHFAVSRMARMNLQCEKDTFRRGKQICRGIEETGKQLENLRNDENYCESESFGAKIQRLTAEADFYCYKEQFPEAKEKAEEALKIAETRQFNLERKPLQEMLASIHSNMTASNSKIYRQTPTATASCTGSSSSNNNSPHSSEYEIEKDF